MEKAMIADIIKINNMGQFMPRHADYWLIAAKMHSQWMINGDTPYECHLDYLWYPIRKETPIEEGYLKEKLGIIDPNEARKALNKWKRAVNNESPRTVEALIAYTKKGWSATIPGRLKSSLPMVLNSWGFEPDWILDRSPVAGAGYTWREKRS